MQQTASGRVQTVSRITHTITYTHTSIHGNNANARMKGYGRTVARVNAEHRAAWQAEKKQAQEAQRKRREQGLEDRRAQTTALMALAMGVVSRMQESEREPEFFRENDEA